MVKSKYVVFPDAKQVDVWEEEISDPGPGEVLCQAEKSLISIGTELSCLNGVFDEGTNWHDWVKYPFRPGYSMVGKVIAVGEGVEGIKEGDRLAGYDPHQQYYKVTLFDVEKRYDIPEGIKPYSLPDHVSIEDGTWRSLACTTQNGIRRANFEFGESVGVVGLGILGQLTVQYLAAAGAKNIVAIDSAKSRLDLAQKLGATHTLHMKVQDAVEPVRDITDGWMLDVVLDITGVPAALAPATQLLRRLGRLVLLGDTPTPTKQLLGPGIVSNSVSILGIHGYTIAEQRTAFTPWTTREMSSIFFNYLQREMMNVTELVTHRISPMEAPDTFMRLLDDRSWATGIILDWTQL
jgi:2-desacetyl-2-hydroxyethyl bacteriochlorophyllide A dehydrogenase